MKLDEIRRQSVEMCPLDSFHIWIEWKRNERNEIKSFRYKHRLNSQIQKQWNPKKKRRENNAPMEIDIYILPKFNTNLIVGRWFEKKKNVI